MPGMLKAENSCVPVSSSPSQSSLISSSPRQRQNHSPQRNYSHSSASARTQQLRSEERGLWLIHLLFSCANAVASNNMEYTNLFLEQLSGLASPTGDPMQRVASYFMEGLAARIIKCWPGVYKALHCSRFPSAADLLAAHRIFFNVCPFLKFAFLTVNQAILDAMEGEKVVHLVDLEACDVVQWLTLLQAFSRRAEGPPHLRITVVSERKEVLHQMAQRLSEEAERLDIPFQFHPVQIKLEALEVDMLGVKTGEAVAVSSVMQLHCLLAQEEDHHSIAGASATFRTMERVSSSRFVEENSLQRGSSTAEDLQWERKRRTSPIMGGGCAYERAGNGRAEGGSHLLQPWVDDRGAASKRSRDCLEAEKRELRKREIIIDVGDCSGFGSPSSTSASGDLSLKGGENDEKEMTSEAAYHNGTNVFSLFEKRGAMLQNGRSVDESSQPESESALDRVLRMLRSLCPKAMVVVEQESNHNGVTLVERFVEALHYYSAMFDSMDSTLPQLSIERVTLEKHLFGQEIKNIVACEGLERVERHEKVGSWRKRMQKAGFVHLQLSSATMLQAERLLETYGCEGYRLVEDAGCLTICWHGTPLFSSSAWQV
ncbi:hypothetical protein O6H91_09G076800 [Diphasiastrum complanatum]|uniref:Uncharacterized protein n=1 Tax=Diphasiastrum complanatum TaxID=34168 RepID=A0ACC2CQZ3_DIPCM|nr:hypothetical protein O6H91_09G076800 [Diphasiastrum complanatum]